MYLTESLSVIRILTVYYPTFSSSGLITIFRSVPSLFEVNEMNEGK